MKIELQDEELIKSHRHILVRKTNISHHHCDMARQVDLKSMGLHNEIIIGEVGWRCA